MYWISTLERVKLNYAMCTIATIIIYTFFIQFTPQKLYLTVLFFILSECIKLFIIQKFYVLDMSNNMEIVIKKRRRNKIVESIKFSSLILLTVFFFSFICVVLGAPVLEYYEETFTLSALLTSLTLFPISLLVGINATTSIILTDSFELSNAVSKAFLKLLKRNAYLVIFGAFIGSVAFPLDWERPWQIYPIPNIVGAITGQMLGCFYCLVETMVQHKLGKKYH